MFIDIIIFESMTVFSGELGELRDRGGRVCGHSCEGSRQGM